MHFGINTTALSRAGFGIYGAIAQSADELGFESLWVGHHMAFSSEISPSYPYAASGVSPQDPAGHRPDPWVLFAYLSGLTERLRFCTGVYVLPLVNPFSTARAVMTADVLSGGRMMLGLGVGWNADEFATVGAEFSNRGARTDEIIEILRRLWTTEEHIEFHGKHYSFGPVEFQPKPIQKPYPPLYYGGGLSPIYGTSPKVIRRAAGLNGFVFGPGASIEQMSEVMDEITTLRRDNGHENEPYEFTVISRALPPTFVSSLQSVGVDRVVFEVGVSPFDESGEWLPSTAEAMIANLHDVAERLFA